MPWQPNQHFVQRNNQGHDMRVGRVGCHLVGTDLFAVQVSVKKQKQLGFVV